MSTTNEQQRRLSALQEQAANARTVEEKSRIDAKIASEMGRKPPQRSD